MLYAFEFEQFVLLTLVLFTSRKLGGRQVIGNLFYGYRCEAEERIAYIVVCVGQISHQEKKLFLPILLYKESGADPANLIRRDYRYKVDYLWASERRFLVPGRVGWKKPVYLLPGKHKIQHTLYRLKKKTKETSFYGGGRLNGALDRNKQKTFIIFNMFVANSVPRNVSWDSNTIEK